MFQHASTCFKVSRKLDHNTQLQYFAPLWPGPRHCLCSSFVDHKFGKQILPMGIKGLVSIFSPSSKCLQHTGWRENPLGHMPLSHPIHQSWPKFQFLPAQTRKVKRSVRSQRTMRITSYYIHIIESHGSKMMQTQDACLKCLNFIQ